MEYERYFKTVVINEISDNSDLQIGYCGHEKTRPDKEETYSTLLPYFRLIYIVTGSVILKTQKKEEILNANTFFLLSPTKKMSYLTLPSDPATIYFISFSGLKAMEYIQLMGFKNADYVSYKNNPKDIIRIYSNNFKYKKSPLIDIVLKKNFLRLVENLYNNCSSPIETTSEINTYVQQAIQFINKNYSNPELSIKHLANNLFIHENYLSKLLKTHLGLTFSDLLIQKRMEVALKMFEDGKTSVSEVALAVGFFDPLYFSKLFKQQQLISPTEHIKKLKQEKDSHP